MVIDRDPRAVTILREVHLTRLEEGGPKTDVVPAETMEKALEVLREKKFDLILIEEEYLDARPQEWITSFREKLKISQSPDAEIILMGYKEDRLAFFRGLIHAGYVDYLTKPLDRPLLIQKTDLVASRSGPVERQLYAMKVAGEVNIANVFWLEEISEFGLTAKTDRPFRENETVSLYAEAFKAANQPELVARCYRCSPHPGDGKFFLANFIFIGVGPSSLTSIRTWMRQEYVKKKAS